MQSIPLPINPVQIQHAVDLLIASSKRENCVKDRRALLVALAERGHQVPQAKLLFCKEVEYTGYALSERGRKTSSERIIYIQHMFKPIKKETD